jgi:DNA (cytosine-5)-methyltransferase 1
MPLKYSVVDLFCGIGGLSHGFVKEGFKVSAGIDFDLSCKFAYETNNNADFLHKDLTVTHSKEIEGLFPKGTLKILVGCAPCQAFSTYSQRYKSNDKWKLLYSFSRFIREVRPAIVSMENVPNLLKYDRGAVFNDFVENLKSLNYFVSYQIVNASDYGVPQNRKRLILFASQLGEVDFIRPTHTKRKVTVRNVIYNLPTVEDGIHHPEDRFHRARKLSPLNKRRIQATPEGGGWKDWPEELLLECHKKDSGKTYRSVYGRMSWDDVAPTLTTQCTGLGNGRFGHPEQDRAITLREAALLQSFPLKYELFDPNLDLSTPALGRHIGNAVPVNLGRMVAKSIKNHLKKYG